jgi:hypothetical protein
MRYRRARGTVDVVGAMGSLLFSLAISLGIGPASAEGEPSFLEPLGWTREGSAVAFVGGAFRDRRRFAIGTSLSYGFRYMRSLRAPGARGGAFARAMGASWIGNQHGLDVVITTLYASGQVRAGPSLDLVTRTVILDGTSTRVRAPAMLGFLVPDPGVLFEQTDRAWLHLRWSAPFSILVRNSVGVELVSTTGVVLLGGPPFTYVTFGVGVVARGGRDPIRR